MSEANRGAVGERRALVGLARWCAYVSAAVAVVGIVALVALYVDLAVTGEERGFGEVNDAAVVAQHLLLLPIAFALHARLRPSAPGASLATLLAGVAGMVWVVVLQALLLAGVVPFERQILMVLPGFLVVIAWFLLVARLGRRSGLLPLGAALSLLAGLYFGYPVWAVQVGRRLADGPAA